MHSVRKNGLPDPKLVIVFVCSRKKGSKPREEFCDWAEGMETWQELVAVGFNTCRKGE